MASDLLILATSTTVLATPLILASMGGYTSERGGVINIALEGFMLVAAAATSIVALATGSPIAGLAAGIGGAVLLCVLHWLFTQAYHVDHIISGMALNAVAAGGATFLDQKLRDPSQFAEIPKMPPVLYYAAAIAVPIALWIYSRRTRGGLRLIAVGSDPEKARLAGVEPVRVRLWALVATGVFCGLAGAVLVSNAGRFTDGMTAGRGYIALAALIIGGWRPIPAAIACVAFAFFDALQIQLQGTQLLGHRMPPEVWQSLPYVATVLALAGLLGRSRAPLGLGRQ